MYDTGVVQGRFQVFHNDHLKYLVEAKTRCRRLVVGITNPDPALTRDDEADPNRSLEYNNPLTYFERHIMVKEVLLEQGFEPRNFHVVPLPINIPELYHYYVPMDAVFFITIYDDWGRRKLFRFQEMGLRTEVLWEKTVDEKQIAGADIRRKIVAGLPWEEHVPPAAARMLKDWGIQKRLAGADLMKNKGRED